jgi:hypothetical protein
MDWKGFLRPSRGKVGLFAILCAMAFLLVLYFNVYALVGLPLFVAKALIALVFWYLIACLLVWAYGRLRKGK